MRDRKSFLAATRGRRFAAPGFVLLVHDRRDDDRAIRMGFTVTKKIGNAVVRNRMKRRLRELARDLLPSGGQPGADHVLIGRAGGVERDFSAMRGELEQALAKTVRATKTVSPEPVEGRLSDKKQCLSERHPSTSSGLTESG